MKTEIRSNNSGQLAGRNPESLRSVMLLFVFAHSVVDWESSKAY